MSEAVARVPHLRVVDTTTGEISEVEECPSCLQYEKDLRILKARLTRLETDKEEEARRHKLWAEASTLHDWWALATGHERTRFAAEEFYEALPRLKERTPIEILQGIAGIAYDPNTKQKRNGGVERYDSWSLLLRSGEKLQQYMDRAPGLPDPHAWKRWLIARIEGSFK